MKRVVGRTLVAMSLMAGAILTVGAAGVTAQSATPVAGCDTEESNLAVINSYLTALQSGDTATLDAILADDFKIDLSSNGIEVPNEPGNADEIAYLTSEGVTYTVKDVIANDDKVAISFDFSVDPSAIPGSTATEPIKSSGIVIVDIECGEIVEVTHEIDLLTLVFESGYTLTAPGE